MSNFLEMQAAAIKQGNEYEKDGVKHRYDTVTFITPDGDSFKLQIDGLKLPLKAQDTCVFGVRSVMTDQGRPAAALFILTARPAKQI